MKKSVVALCALMLALPSPAAASTTHDNKLLGALGMNSSFACVLFTLDGVTLAEPLIPNSPYFALSRFHPHFAEIYAALLTAKATNRPVNVLTSGNASSCAGFAEVQSVGL